MARMAKRSLSEQLDKAVQAIITGPGRLLPPVDSRLSALARLAADLRQLPRESFKARIKSDLERKTSMATIAEPASIVQSGATPYLTIENAAEALEFYKKAFSARETMRLEDHGKIGHAEIMIGESLIMIADEYPDYGALSPKTIGGSPVRLHLYVEDADSLVRQAAEAGAKVLRPVADQFYGDRSGQVADPFGYTWILATRKENLSLDELQQRWDKMMAPAQPKKPVVNPIREGFRTVTPYLVAEDGPQLLDFTKQAFGAVEMSRGIGSAGGLHGEVRLGDSMMMIGGGIPGREFSATASTGALHVYVENVDEVYEKALKAGATSISKPIDQEYGERSAGVKDPAGNYWYIATHTGPSFVPEGLNQVNVYMHPLRGEPVINFLKRAFGARELGKYASPEGVIMHAEIRVGTSVVELGEAHGPYQPMKSMFYLYVPDVDAVYRRALQAGAASISAPADQPYGDRNAGVKDPFGNDWYIASHIKDVAS